MTAHDRIRLTGLLREGPPQGGPSYCWGDTAHLESPRTSFTTLLAWDGVTAYDYRCGVGPDESPSTELHRSFSISYVRKGSFGYHSRGRQHELVPGSVLVGFPGDEYLCTHDHACGDECLRSLRARAGGRGRRGRCALAARLVAPVPDLEVLGQLGQAAAERRSDVGLEEVGMLLATRLVRSLSGKGRSRRRSRDRDRRRAVEAALWIEAHSHEPLALDDMARQSGLSPFHFLRLFGAVLGVTPHE